MDLHLEVFFGYGVMNDTRAIDVASKFFPKLKWMVSLRNIIILKKAQNIFVDSFLPKLIETICSNISISQLECLWVPFEVQMYLPQPHLLTAALSLKSISMGDKFLRDGRIAGDNFRQLEHVHGIHFAEMAEFPNFRFALGWMISVEVSTSKRLWISNKKNPKYFPFVSN